MPSPSDPVAFDIGGLSVRWYAIFILLGVVAAVALVRWLAVRRGLDPGFPLDVAPWLVLGGIVGARLYYLLLRFDYFAARPEEAFNLRLGGLSIHGAMVVGTGILAWFCWRHRQPFWRWADVIVPGLALAQAIGRWGNWANQEAFGRPTSLPWGVAIDPEHRPSIYADATYFHPTFLYESLVNLVNAVVLSWLVLNAPRLRLRDGDVLGVYLIIYGVARFVIESARTDSLYIGPFPAAHWLSVALVLIGAGIIVLRRRANPQRPPGTAPTR